MAKDGGANAGGLVLSVREADRPVRVVESRGPVVKIGRLASADIVVDDADVERMHAVIEVGPGGELLVADLGSRAGTFVNGTRVSKATIGRGDEVRVGRVSIRIGAAGGAVAEELLRGTEPRQPVTAAIDPVSPDGAGGDAFVDDARGDGGRRVEGPVTVAVGPKMGNVVTTDVTDDPRDAELPIVGFGAPPGYNGAGALETSGGKRVHSSWYRLVESSRGPVGVEIEARWCGTVVARRLVRGRESISIGESPAASFYAAAERLPSDPFNLLVGDAAGRRLRLFDGIDGECVVDGKAMAFSELAGHPGRTAGEHPNTWTVPFDVGAAATVRLGDVEIELRAIRLPRALSPPLIASINTLVIVAFLASFLVHGVVYGVLASQPADPHGFNLDRLSTEDRFVRILFKPEVRPPSERAKRLMSRFSASPIEKKAALAKHAGREGRAGVEDAPRRDTRFGVKGNDPGALALGERKRRDQEIVKSTAMMKELDRIEKDPELGRLFRPSGGGKEDDFRLTSDWAKGQAKGGDSVTGAGAPGGGGPVGDQQGRGGFGEEGGGEGGGGIDKSVGIADVATKGLPGVSGQPKLRVKRGKLDLPRGTLPPVSGGDVSITGRIDREMVRRIIRQRLKEIQYCYQVEYERDPSLSGKIVVVFGILPGGEVDKCSIKESTMKSQAVEGCVCEKIRRWEFQKSPLGERVSVQYPFLFKPAGKN